MYIFLFIWHLLTFMSLKLNGAARKQKKRFAEMPTTCCLLTWLVWVEEISTVVESVVILPMLSFVCGSGARVWFSNRLTGQAEAWWRCQLSPYGLRMPGLFGTWGSDGLAVQEESGGEGGVDNATSATEEQIKEGPQFLSLYVSELFQEYLHTLFF